MGPRIAVRKQLHADALFRRIRAAFAQIADHRPGDILISLADALMSAFAMFSLKGPSLLAFDTRRKDPSNVNNVQRAFHLTTVPCDTQMREIVDPVAPGTLSPISRDIFRHLQRGTCLERVVFLDDDYLVSVDGTQYFSSTQIHYNSRMAGSEEGRFTVCRRTLSCM